MCSVTDEIGLVSSFLSLLPLFPPFLSSCVSEMECWLEDIRMAIDLAEQSISPSSDQFSTGLLDNSKSSNIYHTRQVFFCSSTSSISLFSWILLNCSITFSSDQLDWTDWLYSLSLLVVLMIYRVTLALFLTGITVWIFRLKTSKTKQIVQRMILCFVLSFHSTVWSKSKQSTDCYISSSAASLWFSEPSEDNGVELESEDELSTSRSSLERQCHRGNTTVHVCWHRNTSVSMVDFSVAVEVWCISLTPPFPLGKTLSRCLGRHLLWSTGMEHCAVVPPAD